jgi:hypothetical protein
MACLGAKLHPFSESSPLRAPPPPRARRLPERAPQRLWRRGRGPTSRCHHWSHWPPPPPTLLPTTHPTVRPYVPLPPLEPLVAPPHPPPAGWRRALRIASAVAVHPAPRAPSSVAPPAGRGPAEALLPRDVSGFHWSHWGSSVGRCPRAPRGPEAGACRRGTRTKLEVDGHEQRGGRGGRRRERRRARRARLRERAARNQHRRKVQVQHAAPEAAAALSARARSPRARLGTGARML